MDRNAKTLIILSPGFPENEADTACLPSQQLLVKAIKKNFPEINIVILAFQYPFTEKTYQWNDTTVISFNGRNKEKLQRLKTWLAAWRQLKKLRKEHNIIGILSFWCTECALIGKYFSKLYNLKHLIWVLGQDAKKTNKYVKLIRPKAEELIVISDFLLNEFSQNHGVRPSHIVPVGIDPEMFEPANSEKKIDLLGVGNLIPLKRYDVFIEVVKKISTGFPNVNGVICGKGEEQDKLNNLITRLQLENNVSLVGEKPHKEVLHFMQQTKVLLHTSAFEGFGVVCAEALYAGAHVISFTKPLKEDIQNWHIVTTDEEMASKAVEILRNRSLRHESILLYTVNDAAKKIMALF